MVTQLFFVEIGQIIDNLTVKIHAKTHDKVTFQAHQYQDNALKYLNLMQNALILNPLSSRARTCDRIFADHEILYAFSKSEFALAICFLVYN